MVNNTKLQPAIDKPKKLHCTSAQDPEPLIMVINTSVNGNASTI
jgi:hypothetical protein